MRDAIRRPGARGDAEGPQSADADSAPDGDAQAAARQQRAHKRREAANDADADAFNKRHAAEVAEFNQRTNDACLGEDGKLDAAAVKEWQREHGVAPDGKVGPKTIAAAGGKADDAKNDADAAKDTDAAKIDQAKAEKKKGPAEDV
ncbi:MAG: peptidoglycan-binding protein, partial [Myxococcales bacterium]|nr:peptidoglycan-binding protein [Myxococcales bacterium]